MIGLQSCVSPPRRLAGDAALFLVVLFVVFVTIKYSPIVSRHFQHQPPFMPLRVSPGDAGETGRLHDRRRFAAQRQLPSGRTPEQAGVIVYCHEYLSDRWSYHPYVDHLRDLGFDLFTFDFRNHGESDSEPDTSRCSGRPTARFATCARALEVLRSRPDRDPAGFGLFGVSRGGTTALVAASTEPDVWGVVTDGAFPTHGTMVPYIKRWCEIYVPNPILRSLLPVLDLRPGGHRPARRHTETAPELPVPQRRSGRRQAGSAALAHDSRRVRLVYQPRDRSGTFRPGQEIQGALAGQRAKHNRCRETDPDGYAARIVSFLERFAPRRPWLAQPGAPQSPPSPPVWPTSSRRPIYLVRSRLPSQADEAAGATNDHDQVSQAVDRPAGGQPRAPAGPGLPRPDPPRRRRPARASACAGSPATPTASSAATTTSARFARPKISAAACPIGGYDRHEPYIDRVRNGDTGALFGQGTEVLMFAMTSGTTNRPKTIPVTPEALR